MKINNIETTLRHLPLFHSEVGLSRIDRFIKDNGAIPNCFTIIIGGTNGKGSVSAYLENVISNAGLNVGCLRSPHVYSPCERISRNCIDIDEGELEEVISFVLEYFQQKNVTATLADVTTACALLYFSHYEKPDILILEVGMGGRLDPVNAVRRDVAVITNIGRDHTGVLGDSPLLIAKEKAGIITSESPLFTAEEDPDILQIFLESCIRCKVQMQTIDCPEILSMDVGGMSFSYGGIQYKTGIPGYQQGKNAALAIEILGYMGKNGFNISLDAVKKGLSKTKLPWRMEKYSDDPLIILDGAHNRESWENLRRTLQYFKYRNLHIILFVMETKVPEDFPRHFPGELVFLHIPKIDNLRYYSPNELDRKINSFSGKKIVYQDLGTGILEALSMVGSKDLVMVTGSYGLAKDVLSALGG